jgi:hypothetical protein
MQINTVDLSDVTLEDENTSGQSEEQLEQKYKLGEIVEVPAGVGAIAAFAEEPFEYPVGAEDRVERIEDEDEEIGDDEMEEIDASEDEPVYIVALQEGGSVAVTADEISSGTLEGDDGVEITSWDDEQFDEGAEAEMAPIYSYADDPSNVAELEEAKKELIMERQAAHLADHVEANDVSLAELGEYSYEELVNIPGVDDPHVGFDELPPGWTRKSVLQAWASLGGMWRTCYARMVRVRGPNFAKRWCAALKDEVLRTEEWRGKF